MGRKRTTYRTKSGSYFGSGPRRKGRGKPVKKLTNRQHRILGTLQSKNRAAAHTRKKSR